MTKGDRTIDAGAEKLQSLSARAAARGGLARKLAGELAEDAAFLRKLKPSLIVARAKGEAPKDAEPGAATVPAPTGAQLGRRSNRNGGANPFAVAAGAFVGGVLLAKIIDWRGHAHPRR